MPTAKPLLRRVALFALAAALVAVLVCLWSRPVPPPEIPPLPQPNGYDDFVKAGRLRSGRFYDRSMALENLRNLIAENAEALALARLGLTRECRVPINFSTNF